MFDSLKNIYYNNSCAEEGEKTMKKITSVLVCVCLILLMCSCGNNTDTSTGSDGSKTVGSNAGNPKPKEPLDIENLKENEFRISDLPGKITVSDEYHVYSTDNEYTAEMCTKQGITPDKMKLYVDTQKEYGGINMIIIPAENPIVSSDFVIQIKVKSENDYKLENLADVSDADFESYKESLVSGFESSLGAELTPWIYENSNTKWIAFDCFMVSDQTRYATILNGKMIYVIGKNSSAPLNDAQKSEITKIIDTLQF